MLKYESLKANEKRVVDCILSMLSERDENLNTSLQNMDEAVKKAFSQVGFALTVIKELLLSLGVTEQKFQEVSERISRGDQNEETSHTEEQSSEDSGTGEEVSGDSNIVGGGDEHFGQ